MNGLLLRAPGKGFPAGSLANGLWGRVSKEGSVVKGPR